MLTSGVLGIFFCTRWEEGSILLFYPRVTVWNYCDKKKHSTFQERNWLFLFILLKRFGVFKLVLKIHHSTTLKV